MKIVIAPDTFKGSLSATEVSAIMQESWRSVFPKSEILCCPMSDGGEGMLECLNFAVDGKLIHYRVQSAGKKKLLAEMLISGETAYLESAQTVGLNFAVNTELPVEKRSSAGVGEQILKAVEQKNVKRIVIGLGGSSTNDGGLGMLCELGLKFLNRVGDEIDFEGLLDCPDGIVDFSLLNHRLRNIEIIALCDVINPLLGLQGATYVFGPQKGVQNQSLEKMEKRMERYAHIIRQTLKKDFSNMQGAGAAGGLGYAILVLGGKIMSGAEYLLDALGVEVHVKSADLIITGEGKSDSQTLLGKLPLKISQLCREAGKPVFLISGSLETASREKLMSHFTGCFSLIDSPASLPEILKNSRQLLSLQTINLAQIYKKICR